MEESEVRSVFHPKKTIIVSVGLPKSISALRSFVANGGRVPITFREVGGGRFSRTQMMQHWEHCCACENRVFEHLLLCYAGWNVMWESETQHIDKLKSAWSQNTNSCAFICDVLLILCMFSLVWIKMNLSKLFLWSSNGCMRCWSYFRQSPHTERGCMIQGKSAWNLARQCQFNFAHAFTSLSHVWIYFEAMTKILKQTSPWVLDAR